MIRFALLFLCLFAGAAQAAIPPDLTYVDQTSPQYARFKDWVDQAIAGNPGYAFSATDAATMYRLTGTAAYAQRAVAEVEAQVAEAEAEIAAGRRAPISYDSYLEVGQMLRDLALTYDWCAPFVTQSQKTRWANYAEQAVWNVWNPDQAHWGAVSAPWSGWSIDDPGNNYFYSFLEGTMYWAFASNSATWKSFLQNQKWPQLTSYFGAFPGGGSREGTGYGLSHQRLFELYRVWRDGMGVDYGASNTHRDDSIDWWIHATMPTLDRVAPIGDQSRVSYPDLFDYHRNVVLQARASSADATRRAHASWWLNAISVPEMGQGFMYRHDLLSPTDAGAPPTALHYAGSGTGVLFARTSWSTDAMWLGFVAGVFDQSHAHREQGSFTLFARDFLAVTENIFTHSGIQEGSDTNNVLRFEKAGQVIEQQRDTTSTCARPSRPRRAASPRAGPGRARGTSRSASSRCTTRSRSAPACPRSSRSTRRSSRW